MKMYEHYEGPREINGDYQEQLGTLRDRLTTRLWEVFSQGSPDKSVKRWFFPVFSLVFVTIQCGEVFMIIQCGDHRQGVPPGATHRPVVAHGGRLTWSYLRRQCGEVVARVADTLGRGSCLVIPSIASNSPSDSLVDSLVIACSSSMLCPTCSTFQLTFDRKPLEKQWKGNYLRTSPPYKREGGGVV